MNENDAKIEIRNEFAVHRLNPTGMGHAERLATMFSAFLTNLEAACGTDGREMALVRTKLQEASYYAKRAIAVRPENQAK